jgi:hypothetical protein
MLTDGVRAIGGRQPGKLDVTARPRSAPSWRVQRDHEKFKKARDSILEQEKMQKEIEVAKQIQQSLLPRRRPEISGYDICPLYQAAAEVGGDYYDFVQVDDDTIGVVVADVSGKGVPGSLVMTMIRTALRMEARGNRNASDVMSKMNAFVTDDMKKGMFVTMFYVILDSKNRILVRQRRPQSHDPVPPRDARDVLPEPARISGRYQPSRRNVVPALDQPGEGAPQEGRHARHLHRRRHRGDERQARAVRRRPLGGNGEDTACRRNSYLLRRHKRSPRGTRRTTTSRWWRSRKSSGPTTSSSGYASG